ncbi:DUF3151 domain-containing protein [Corynebacterium sp. 153RC1]|uniref:DUF3151 domain-containing protein n=1 Tax=unclassified Corynebacterium TaxID=2624378 RepID=UPI00211C0496|nr:MULTISPECIES: DUF3151 domain-containing protein [unclassified Corynebacterium]MCQ9370006.1 DUF3151 domain-containing protein [Corynebacterium sp. 35RC1]MCQ9352151.1 DUF3151 domain-containing protein [Corynebacterium sp. 209RC1]MCQ9354154.1 DUF3151 domain-containing protein [Corynebacterium sp. 1222RC1]MCQ9356434.1 DUF3151 domain-containing protein [Corynebacterium sp. 122RC1]MCQ9358536.1 DUF3151 domain-containing protein [Corynebacterium sp. 142RC1]
MNQAHSNPKTVNDMLAPPPVHLPEDYSGEVTVATVLEAPASPYAWATLALERIAAAAAIEGAEGAEAKAVAYAFARTAYHRSLDRLRANGWKGFGPVPASHEPNRGVLMAIAALAKASALIGDEAEYDRCRQMLSDAAPTVVADLLDN